VRECPIGQAPAAQVVGAAVAATAKNPAQFARSLLGVVGAAKESGSGLEEADPTVKAFNEVARPMARGYEMLTGGSHERSKRVGCVASGLR